MAPLTDQIDRLDVGIFQHIHSQTSTGDKRSLLAIQRATAKQRKEYAYLEIGSHLGGSIQPHLFDARCRKIYSIDPRPAQQPDDRAPGHVAFYENNSSERMLSLLRGTGLGDISKIECFDLDASKVDLEKITDRPSILFIDGEHTRSAVLSDFRFCLKVVDDKATLVFHDFDILYPAIAEACRLLEQQGRRFLAYKLEGGVFAVFFDPDLVHRDPYLSSLVHKQRWLVFICRAKRTLKRLLPTSLLRLVRTGKRP